MKIHISIFLLFSSMLFLSCIKESLNGDEARSYTLKVVQYGTGIPLSDVNVNVRSAGYNITLDSPFGVYFNDSIFSIKTNPDGIAKFKCSLNQYLLLTKKGYLKAEADVENIGAGLEMVPRAILHLKMNDKGLYPDIRELLYVRVWSKAKLTYRDYTVIEHDPSDIQNFSVNPNSSQKKDLFLQCAAGIPNSLMISGYMNGKYRELEFDNILVSRDDTTKIEFDY